MGPINTINTSDCQSVCSAGKSGDSLVKFSDVNIIIHNPSKTNINDQLKTIKSLSRYLCNCQ